MASPLVCREGSEKRSCYVSTFTSYIEIYDYTLPVALNCMLRHGKVAIEGLCHYKWIMNIFSRFSNILNNTSYDRFAAILGRKVKTRFLLDSFNLLTNSIIKILQDALFSKLVAAYRMPPMTLKIVLTATFMSLKNYSESSLMTYIGKNRPMREKESLIKKFGCVFRNNFKIQ